MSVPLRPSAIELAHLEQTVVTAGYALIVRKIEETKEQLTDAVLSAKDWEAFLEARGKLRGIDLALDAPNKLKVEITEKLRKEGK